MTLARSSNNEEVSRYQQDIEILREDLDLTKNQLSDTQSTVSQLKVDNETLSEELEKERKCHDEAVLEVNRRGEDLATQDRQLSECRQQVIVLEGQLEQNQETSDRLEDSLANYKQKYQTTIDQLTNLENSFASVQDQLAESRSKVNLTVIFLVIQGVMII